MSIIEYPCPECGGSMIITSNKDMFKVVHVEGTIDCDVDLELLFFNTAQEIHNG